MPLRNDAVSNLLALSFAGVIFLVLFSAMVLQTVDSPEVSVPGNHEAFADELYNQPILASSTNCMAEALNECWYTLGLTDAGGYLDTATIEAILAGVRVTGPDPATFSEGELAYLVGGWFSIQPFLVTRDIEIIVIETAQDCSGTYDSPWPQYDSANVDCMKVVPGNPPCHKSNPPNVCLGQTLAEQNPDVVVVNAINNWDFDAVEDWFIVNPRGLLVMANVNEASDLIVAADYLDNALPSYLGGLYDLTFPDSVDVQSESTGPAPVTEGGVWHVEGAIASTRPGSLSNQVIITSQPMTAPVFENLLARGEGSWLEYGERDDFNSADRVVTDGLTLHLLKAWSAPSTY